MKRWMIFLAIPVALALIGALAVKLYFTEERLKALIVPGVESATHREVELGSISLSFFPSIGVTLGDVRLSNPPRGEFPNPYFLSLKRLFIDLRLIPLFSNRLEIDNLILEAPVIYLDVTADGRKNYSAEGGAKAAAGAADSAASSSSPPGALLLANLEIIDGRIESHNRKLDSRWTIEGLDQTMRVETAPGGTTLTISGKSDIRKFSYGTGSSWYLEGVPLTAAEEFTYDIAGDRLDFTSLAVALKEVSLRATGSIGDLRQDVMMMDLRVESPDLTVERLLSLLPAAMMEGKGSGVAATGNVSFSMKISGPSGDEVNPAVSAAFRLSDGTVRYPSIPKSITGVAFDGTLEMPSAPVGAKGVGQLDIGRFAATLGSNSLSGKLRVSGFGDPDVTASLKGNVALGELKDYYPLQPGTVLAGSLASDVSIDGRTSDPRSMKASGTLKFRNVSYSATGMARPVRNLNGEVAFNNQVVDIKGIELAIGGSDLRLDASLRNYLSLASSGDEKPGARPFLTFELKSKVLNTADISSAGDSAGAGATAGGQGAGSGGLILPGIDMSGTIDIGTLKTEKFTFTNAKGGLSMNEGVAKLKGMQLEGFGGTIKTDGTLDLSRPDRRPFDLKLDVKGVESNALLTPFTTFGRYLFGTLSLTTSFKGDLNDTLGITPATLTGDGSALIANGKLTGVPLLEKLSGFLSADHLREVDFDSWSQSFSVADGKLNIRDLKIAGGDVSFLVNGTHGLDGSMDYEMRVQLPKSVSDKVRLQGVADQLLQFFKDKEGRLNLDFLVGGQTTSPALKLDTRAQEAMLKQKLQDEAAKKLSEPLKKAAEGLKKLFKPKP